MCEHIRQTATTLFGGARAVLNVKKLLNKDGDMHNSLIK